MDKKSLYSLTGILLSLVVAGCGDGGSYTPAVPPSPTTLSASVSSLMLAVNDTALNAALTGTPRTITLTNTGSFPATSVAYSASPVFPAGTTIAPANCGDIAPAGSCVLTVTPGATPSAAPGDTAPVPVTLSIAGSNTNTLGVSVQVLGYGSVHQSGYVFSIDDTTPNTGSVGGKSAALTDQSAGIIWSSNGSAGVPAFDSIPGIHETSTNPPDACNGSTEGACNTAVITAFYSPPQTNPGVNLAFYAAGLCAATISGFSDWYLPAICELGYDTFTNGSGCGASLAPTLQNMQSNLVDNGNIGGLAGSYWSSSEFSGNPAGTAWSQLFAIGGGSTQVTAGKSIQTIARCARALTN